MKRADKWLSAALILALIIPLAAILPAAPARAADIFSENFDSYVNGTLLNSSPGGWVQVYNGAGDAAQHVDNTRAVSGTQSMTLTGTSPWSAMAYHAVSFPSRFSYDAMIYSGGSAGQDNGWIGLSSANYLTWYGTVRFSLDGYIYAWNGSYTQLMAYTPGAWYKVKVYMDLDARTFDVYIDGTLKGSNISIGFEGTPTGIFLETGNDYVQVWFDDVKVYDGAYGDHQCGHRGGRRRRHLKRDGERQRFIDHGSVQVRDYLGRALRHDGCGHTEPGYGEFRHRGIGLADRFESENILLLCRRRDQWGRDGARKRSLLYDHSLFHRFAVNPKESMRQVWDGVNLYD